MQDRPAHLTAQPSAVPPPPNAIVPPYIPDSQRDGRWRLLAEGRDRLANLRGDVVGEDAHDTCPCCCA